MYLAPSDVRLRRLSPSVMWYNFMQSIWRTPIRQILQGGLCVLVGLLFRRPPASSAIERLDRAVSHQTLVRKVYKVRDLLHLNADLFLFFYFVPYSLRAKSSRLLYCSSSASHQVCLKSLVTLSIAGSSSSPRSSKLRDYIVRLIPWRRNNSGINMKICCDEYTSPRR